MIRNVDYKYGMIYVWYDRVTYSKDQEKEIKEYFRLNHDEFNDCFFNYSSTNILLISHDKTIQLLMQKRPEEFI